jgi:putative endonuclease
MADEKRPTCRQRRGAWAEALVVDHLGGRGWQVVSRNVRVGRDEVDVLATDPGPPPTLVVVEVRGLHSRLFGTPEERVDRHKVARLYRAAAALRATGEVDGRRLPALPWRVDLVVVDARDGVPQLRHIRAIEPP